MNGMRDEARVWVHAIWTRRRLALGVAWGVCVLGWLVVAQVPSRYESRARVFVQMRSVLPDQPGDTSGARDVDSIRQTLTSAVVLEKVVRGTDLAATVPSERDVAARVAGLANAIKVTAQQDNLFEIDAVASSPRLARQITAKLIDVFVERNLSADRTTNTQSLRFLDGQLAELQRKLANEDAERADFQDRYLGALPGTGSVADRMGAARDQMAQVEGDLAAAQSGLSAVNGQMAGTRTTMAGAAAPAAALGPARTRLATIQGQLANARARGLTDRHPDVVALKGQLLAAQGAAANERFPGGGAATAEANPLYLSLRSMQADKAAQVAALQMRRAQIAAGLGQLQSKLSGDPGAAARQAAIDHDEQVLKAQYDQLLANRQQVALKGDAQSESDQVKFSVVDPPTSPRKPTAPNRPPLLTGVLLAGLAAGVGAAFGLAQVKATFPTAGRLEAAAGMPVLGQVGEMMARFQADARRRSLRLFAGGLGGLGAAYLLLLGVEMLQRGPAA